MKLTKYRSLGYCIAGSGDKYCQQCMQKKRKFDGTTIVYYCEINDKILGYTQSRFGWCKKNELKEEEK